MIPAKNRDRKCSTCRHYQPSPLWRKGWCRNPLLYDRNTNHLVEADSLACNRTFIDYWEPITGPMQQVGPQARTNKPRIAPSIPMNTTDAKGNRGVVTGNTPATGMAAVAPAPQRGQRYPGRHSAAPHAYRLRGRHRHPGAATHSTRATRQRDRRERLGASHRRLTQRATSRERVRQEGQGPTCRHESARG